MFVGDNVLFYTTRQNTQDKEVLFDQVATLGVVKEIQDTTIVVDYTDWYTGFSLTDEVPKEFVEPAREIARYQFWRKPGFHKNIWGYVGVVVFFYLFIKN